MSFCDILIKGYRYDLVWGFVINVKFRRRKLFFNCYIVIGDFGFKFLFFYIAWFLVYGVTFWFVV